MGLCSKSEPVKESAAAAWVDVRNWTYAVPVGWPVILSFRIVTLAAGPHLQSDRLHYIAAAGVCICKVASIAWLPQQTRDVLGYGLVALLLVTFFCVPGVFANQLEGVPIGPNSHLDKGCHTQYMAHVRRMHGRQPMHIE